MTRSRRAIWPAVGILMAVAAFTFGACSGGEPTSPQRTAAAGSGGQDPTVTATDPDTGSQSTTLDVHVKGTHFDKGSKAQWAVSGVPSAKVVTNSTTFVSSSELVANITIAADADPVFYDVIVTTTTGKKGIGGELFTVKPSTKTQLVNLSVTVNDAATYMVHSDSLGAYVNGSQGMWAVIDGNGNFQMSPNNANSSTPPQRRLWSDFSQQLSGTPRTPDLTGQWNFKIAVNRTATTTTNIQELAVGASGCYSSYIALGGTQTSGGALDYFNPAAWAGSGLVQVTRTATGTWIVDSDGCSPNASVAAVPLPDTSTKKGGKPAPREYALYLQRFQMTLTAIP